MFTDAMSLLAIAKSDENPSLEIVASDAIPTSGSFSIPITAFTLSGFTYLQSQRSELKKLERELADMRTAIS